MYIGIITTEYAHKNNRSYKTSPEINAMGPVALKIEDLAIFPVWVNTN